MSKKTKQDRVVSREQVVFSFRIPGDMYLLLESDAKQEGRSINSQLLQILKVHLAARPNPAGTSPAGAAYVVRDVALPPTGD